MGLPKLKPDFFTPEEYLKLEREAEFRHEYLNGEIFEMAGANRRHNQISVNIIRLVANQIRDRECSVYGTDMRIKIPNRNYTILMSLCCAARNSSKMIAKTRS